MSRASSKTIFVFAPGSCGDTIRERSAILGIPGLVAREMGAWWYCCVGRGKAGGRKVESGKRKVACAKRVAELNLQTLISAFSVRLFLRSLGKRLKISAFSFQLSAFPHMPHGRLPEEFRQRSKQFASATIKLYAKLPRNREEIRVLGQQMLRAGTSVAAHVREASRARSSAEFASKLGGAVQEADETILWLELLREDCGVLPAWTTPLESEANELIAIISTMIRRTSVRKS